MSTLNYKGDKAFKAKCEVNIQKLMLIQEDYFSQVLIFMSQKK